MTRLGGRTKGVRGWPKLGLAAALVAFACRTPVPEEIVYSGPTAVDGGPTVVSPGANVPPSPKVQLLTAVAACAQGLTVQFEDRARTLDDKTRVHASSPTDGNRDAVRQAWRDAMATWQELEVFGVGPTAPSSEPGGRNLRDAIYAWPLFARCQTEEAIVSKVYGGPGFDAALISVRTLSALEFLAFFDGDGNACGTFSPINAQGTWSAMDPAERARRKADYGRRIAGDVLAAATEVRGEWAEGGAFRREFVTPGAGSKLFPREQDAMNALTRAIFYLDTFVKDAKLARPLGLVDCPEGGCVTSVESVYAKASTAHLRANLAGFSRIALGCAGPADIGFDDLLVKVGAADLASRMKAAIDDAVARANALPPSLEDAIAQSPNDVTALHAAVKKVTDLLKTEFITVLDQELPQAAEGDND
jgi:predicted lipoprotein